MANGHVLRMNVSGADKLGQMLAKHLERSRAAFLGATYLHGTLVITAAMRLTPVLTGWLRRSRWLARPSTTPVAFAIPAGFSAPYAAAVHFRDAQHPTGQAMFLQAAIDAHAPTASAFIARETLRLWRSGATIERVPAVHPSEPVQGPLHSRMRLNKRQRAKRARAAEKNRENLNRFGTTDRKLIRSMTKPNR